MSRGYLLTQIIPVSCSTLPHCLALQAYIAAWFRGTTPYFSGVTKAAIPTQSWIMHQPPKETSHELFRKAARGPRGLLFDTSPPEETSLSRIFKTRQTHITQPLLEPHFRKNWFFSPSSSSFFYFKFNFNRSSDENFEQEVGVVGWRRSKAEPSSLQTDPISRKGQEKRRRGKRFLFKLIPQRPSRIPS